MKTIDLAILSRDGTLLEVFQRSLRNVLETQGVSPCIHVFENGGLLKKSVGTTAGLTWYSWTWQRKAAWIWPGICGTFCRRRQRCCSMERRTICGECCGSSLSG